MNNRQQEKVKPFRLVKYFTYTSLIVIFLGTLLFSFLNIRWARNMHIKKSEDYALLLIDSLNDQIFTQFIIPAVLKFGKIQLRDKAQFEWMDKVVRSTLFSFKVDMVTIYDMNNIISYSFDQRLVGKKNVGGAAYQDAILGKVTSKLSQRGNFFEIFVGFPKESKLITFAPLRAQMPLSRISGPVGGVIELVQDLSDDYQPIFRFQISVITTSAAVMGTLFLILILVVKRGEGIIEQRALERIKLKEQLSRSEHLSSLGEMVAAVSHEIRNPLGIINNSAELLKKKTLSDPSNKLADIIVEESQRLNSIITDFLNFAKPKIPNLLPCRVEEVIEKNIAYLATQIREKEFEISPRYDNNLPEIMADASMLYQAFLNILINAMQAMPKGGRIDITVSSVSKGVEISFEDQGEGIPAEFTEKIWSPFFTTKETGTGLGLGIVKKVIEAHDGTVGIENRPGIGTRVTIQLPIRPEALWKQS
ncbi:MAG: ATP-binding protein [Thermodesulfobacteriota bacterium]